MTTPNTANKCDTCAHFLQNQISRRCAIGYGGIHIAHIMASNTQCGGWAESNRPPIPREGGKQ